MFKFSLHPLEGTKVGNLSIVARAADSPRGRARFFVKCVCGNETIRYQSRLTGKRPIRSCGCQGHDRKARYWTAEDLEFLRREYPVRGHEIAAEMERSPHAVRYKAGKLGLKHDYERHYVGEWTEAEDAILRRYYPTSTIDCLNRLPSRSKSQIRHRAFKLGIHRKKGRRQNQWSRAEVKVLKEHYPTGGWEAVHALLPHRSRHAIWKRAQEKSVAVVPKWTPEEEVELFRLYEQGGVIACRERFPDRTDQSLRGKARKLGAHMSPSWTEEEIEIVRNTFPSKGAKACMALLPNKTSAQIASICKRHQIRSHNWWTTEEENLLREYYAATGAGPLCDLLPHHTEAAIRHKAKKLGLRSDRRWTAQEEAIVARLYPLYGSAGCAEKLPHYTVEAIRNKAQHLGKTFVGRTTLSDPTMSLA